MRSIVLASALLVCTLFWGGSALGESNAELVAQVRDTENAFAKTMADRNLEAFASFIAEDAFFFGQGLRGKQAVVEGWKKFYEGETAPFSWRAETVAVLESGQLAYSSGPVFDPEGKRTATFHSVWRREPNGDWKIVFDTGTCVCGEPKPAE